jgi:hypothetical protein
MTKKKEKLPEKVIVFPNEDKSFHEKWDSKRGKLDIPHPFRIVINSVPNCGKSNTIKNIVTHCAETNPFMRIILIHPDVEYTKEYSMFDELNLIKLGSFPPPNSPYFDGQLKTLCIIDDYDIEHTATKEQKHNLDRLMAYVSTHKNVSVIVALQDMYNAPPSVRRMMNGFILYKVDMRSVMDVMNKLGYNAMETKALFSLLETPHDNIFIDKTKDSPYPLRKNLFELIDFKD